MIRMHTVHLCDHCQNIIEDDYEETIIYFFEMPQSDTYIFCSEDCRDDFLKEYFDEKYIMPNGKIIRD